MSDDFFNLDGEPVNQKSESDTTQGSDSSQNQNPYNQNPYGNEQNPYSQNPYGNGQNPYGQNPYNYGQNQDSTNNGSNYNYGQNPYNNGQNPYANYSPNPNFNMPPKQGPNSLAVTAFVLSLVAPILCCCSSFGIILSAVACIASIVLAFVSKQKKPFHGLAIAAIIIDFIYLAILIFLLVCVIIVFSNPEFMQMYEEMYEEMFNEIYGDIEMDLFRFLQF